MTEGFDMCRVVKCIERTALEPACTHAGAGVVGRQLTAPVWGQDGSKVVRFSRCP
jgi:hypothetical protein